MQQVRNIIERFRARLILLFFIRHFFRISIIIGFLLGTGILVLRVGLSVPKTYLAWLLLAFLPAFILSLVLAIIKAPSMKTLDSLFDKTNNCGGLLMASVEVELGSWQQRLCPSESPALKWKGRKILGLFTLSILFIIVGFLVPEKYTQVAAARPLKIAGEVETLNEQIEALKEENIITEQTADDYELKLKEIKRESSGTDPVKTWETLDHIQDSLKKQAEERANQSLSQAEELAKAEALANALCEGGNEMNEAVSSEAMEELAKMVKELADNNQNLAESLNSDILNACQTGTFDAEQLSKIMQQLKLNRQELLDTMSKMSEARLIDLEKLKLCKVLGQCDANSLKKLLCEDANSLLLGDMLAMCSGDSDSSMNIPGKGEISRGRGDASMTWTDASSEEGVTFKEQVLPRARLDDLKKSFSIGVSIGEPTVEQGAVSGLGALDSASAGGGQALKRQILPRHRDAVRRYFERENN